jgi:HPt (histidine-containing phosphotransfer) domain-containing protein
MAIAMDNKLNSQTESSVFDQEEALARLDGDQELLEELAGIFLDESPEILRRLRDALERGDAEAVAAEAHSMKGSVSNFGVASATEAALAIEMMGRRKDLSRAAQALRHLEHILEILRPALANRGEESA